MMGFGNNMMNWAYGEPWLATTTWIVWLVVGVLASLWLWKQIQKP